MKSRHETMVAGFLVAFLVAAYFGAYFAAADYTDLGSNTPYYLLYYHIGPHSLQHWAYFFEPARQVDDHLLRHHHAVFLTFGAKHP